MITLKSKCVEYMELVKKGNPCGDPVEWLTAVVKQLPNITVGETLPLVKIFLEEKERDFWAFWNLDNIGEEFDAELVSETVKFISTPTYAAQIYLKCKFLSDEDEEILKKVFEGKMPTIEKELEHGLVVPEKVIYKGDI